MNRRTFATLVVVLLLAAVADAGCQTPSKTSSATAFEGTWSAPSLSNPAVPIIFKLLPGGQATEQVGSYQGTGTWSAVAGSARILWASGWVGLLRPTPQGSYELLTWKAGTPPQSLPDDIQLAQQIFLH